MSIRLLIHSYLIFIMLKYAIAHLLMKSVEVLKDCRSLNAAAEMNCPMPRSVEKVPIRNKKRCTYIVKITIWCHEH